MGRETLAPDFVLETGRFNIPNSTCIPVRKVENVFSDPYLPLRS